MKLDTVMKPGSWPAASWAMLRREFWEHSSIWVLPIVVSVLMLLGLVGLMAIPSRIGAHIDEMGNTINIPLEEFTNDPSIGDLEVTIDDVGLGTIFSIAEQVPDEVRGTGLSLILLGVFGSYDIFVKILMGIYLASCLFRERRNNSVLFWKSLPVSDTNTVLVKALVGMVGIPLAFFGISLVTQFLSQLIVGLGALFTGHSMGLAFSDVQYGKVLGHMWMSMITQILWLAPIGGYFMLMSAWAKRNVALWIIGPPLAIVTLEGYFMAKGRFATWVGKRFISFPSIEVQLEKLEHASPMDLLDLSYAEGFAKPDLWIGLLICAAFLAAAIWIRRWREESA